jgi:FixJ family two-component response regulator
MVQWRLRPYGLEVIACPTPVDAKRNLPKAAVVLCDVHIADVNGLDLTRSLRQEGFSGPIIIISGDRSRSTVGGSILAGATDFMAKPFDERMLIDKLEKHARLSLREAIQHPMEGQLRPPMRA